MPAASGTAAKQVEEGGRENAGASITGPEVGETQQRPLVSSGKVAPQSCVCFSAGCLSPASLLLRPLAGFLPLFLPSLSLPPSFFLFFFPKILATEH